MAHNCVIQVTAKGGSLIFASLDGLLVLVIVESAATSTNMMDGERESTGGLVPLMQ